MRKYFRNIFRLEYFGWFFLRTPGPVRLFSSFFFTRILFMMTQFPRTNGLKIPRKIYFWDQNIPENFKWKLVLGQIGESLVFFEEPLWSDCSADFLLTRILFMRTQFQRTNGLKMQDDVKQKRSTTSSGLLRYHYNGKLNALKISEDVILLHQLELRRTLGRRQRATPVVPEPSARSVRGRFSCGSRIVANKSRSGRIIVGPSLVLGEGGGAASKLEHR